MTSSAIHHLTLTITKEHDHYAVVATAQGVEPECFTLTQAEIEALVNRAGLIESFLSHKQPGRFMSDLAAIGGELYQRFLRPFSQFDACVNQAQDANTPLLINIQTDDFAVTCLPWELLYSPEHQFFATSPHFQVLRSSIPLPWRERKGEGDPDLAPGPLRMLFMTCSPDGVTPVLNYEREEEILLNAVADLKRQKALELDIAEGGTLEELHRLLALKEYHVVHLSGHGVYDERKNMGYLLMEQASGAKCKVSASEFADALIGCRSVRLLFLSACESGRETAQNTGLAYTLLAHGIPMVIAMKQSVTDHAATQMAGTFYRELTLKRTVPHALQLARREYAQQHRQSLQWAIPTLFSRDGSTSVVDWRKPLQQIAEQPCPAILYGKVSHRKTGFRGRRREIRECLKQLREGSPLALCLTGAGGVGKSTLASRLTDLLHGSGYTVIPLYGELTPDRFIQATLNALISAKATDHLDFLKGLHDTHDKLVYILANICGATEIIYLFDNFEDNLAQAAHYQSFKNRFWEETFRMLLEHLPDTCGRLLITCRYNIPGLPETSHKPLKELSPAEARKLMLFMPAYQWMTLKQINEVYAAIGGNPKAIEELGALLAETEMTWDAVKTELTQVSQAMREFTLFETLYGFLTTEEQAFFRKISVYQTPVEREALQRQEPEADNLKSYLKKLLDYSLVQAEPGMTTETIFYQVHPLNRQYIKDEWWQTGEQEAAHNHAAEYYLDLLEAGFDVASLSAAVLHLRAGKQFNRMAELILDYSRQMTLYGFWDEKIYLHNLILEEQESVEKRLVGTAYNNIGLIYDNKGEWDRALEYYLKAEAIRLEVGDRAGLGPTYNNIGLIYDNKGEWDRALEYYLKDEQISLEVGDRAGLGPTYNNIGLIYASKGEWDRALEYYLKDEQISLEVGDRAGLSTTYNNIGGIYANKGEWDRALEYYLKAEAIKLEVGDRAGLGPTYNNIGLIYANKGEWDRALEYYLKAEQISLEVGDRAGLAYTYFNIGTLYQEKGETEKAADYLCLVGYLARTLGMKYELSQMAWALEPLIEAIGEAAFLARGQQACRSRGLV
jgi:tetratricopeptide (TPR) repeat protein